MRVQSKTGEQRAKNLRQTTAQQNRKMWKDNHVLLQANRGLQRKTG